MGHIHWKKQDICHCWCEILAGCIEKKTKPNCERRVKEIKTLFQELESLLSVSLAQSLWQVVLSLHMPTTAFGSKSCSDKPHLHHLLWNFIGHNWEKDKIIEWIWLEGTLKVIEFQAPATGRDISHVMFPRALRTSSNLALGPVLRPQSWVWTFSPHLLLYSWPIRKIGNNEFFCCLLFFPV